ncbi:MAG: hypothetical protein HC851_12215 [Acaryochloris sp. RU_4_1]|nr:hypothetical protein [Acaryochloris sp. RU_4_1]
MMNSTQAVFSVALTSLAMGTADPVLLGTAAISIINLNTSGGILKAFNQTLGLSSGAVEIVAAEQNQYLLMAQIKGRNTLTQQAVQGQFEVVQPLTQTDLLVKDSQGRLYRAGETQECQILISQVQMQRLGMVKPSVQEIRLEDESITDAIAQLPQSGRVYISGLLTVEDAEDLVPPNYPDRFNSIRVQPGSGIASVHLQAASPAEVIRVLGDYSASGSLITTKSVK